MTPEGTLQGTRIPDVHRDTPEGWDAWERRGKDIHHRVVAPPGAYMKVLRGDGTTWCWYVRAPDGEVASIGFEAHAVTEFDDGTITVSPSIVMPFGQRWHGFLEHGVWREC